MIPMSIVGSLLPFIIIAVIFIAMAQQQKRRRQRLEQQQRLQLEQSLAQSKKIVEEDVTKFGEELQRLDSDVVGRPLDQAMQQDYTRALDAYENSKQALAAVRRPEEIRNVTEILEDGRYAVACVLARVNNQPLPQKRPPCFFNPAHGPSVRNVKWSPDGGTARDVPACAADAQRIESGADPYIRTVMVGSRQVPYWMGGPAYQPYMQGYYNNWRGSSFLGDMMLTSLIFNSMSAAPWVIGGMAQGMGELGAGIGNGIGDVFGGIGGGLNDIGNGIGDGIQDIGNGIGDVFGDIGGGLNDIGNDIGGWFN